MIYDLPAPAKLNLFLHVTGRQANGYHQIESVFVPINWMDRISLDLRRDGSISRSDESSAKAIALPTEDLCVRAAKALQLATGCRLGVHIHLNKTIPSEAGMGGGSSDAATTLLGLNRLWQLGLDRERLARIGVTLGADVPFFLHSGPAFVEGIGEKITPLTLKPMRFWVLKPELGVPTRAIFESPDLRRDTNPATISAFVEAPFGFGRNDLQPVAEHLCPDITRACAWFRKQGLAPRMTGSGSAVFAPAQPDQERLTAPAGWLIRECCSLEAHPLATWV
ncbi:MAG: 4-(cytidine 5'-diphospho)-2-C-methyl-D-erythritol kinase [Betaproteobacteria bacterium]|jgi:4-diphosphocytidyl-2-C-methyl-D-erythritol kinase|nr:4-(cytidine 5'-diphospho)-2-C-methyl-D-erythritol kinase [Betaproteobacteria bacterium]NBP45510.1 4-(cytidine 5'-diphospho)-2-C-methyl-D-erythritol kinase [Betaproteobacteria bacterium]